MMTRTSPKPGNRFYASFRMTSANLPLGKGILPDALVKTRRRLPHWRVAGSTYFIEFGLR